MALLAVGAVLGVTRVAGPAVAGTVGAFPAMSATLTLLVLRRRGRAAGAHILHGLVCGLPGYLGFCLTVALVAPAGGIAVAVPVALGVCLVAYRMTWRAVRLPAGRLLPDAA